MSGDDSTLTVGPLDSLTGQTGLPTVPALTIVWHPHLDRVGHIAPLTNLLELDVAAAHLGVSTRTLRRWVDAGRVPFRRVGRTLRFPLAALNPR